MIDSTDILHARILIVDDQKANVILLERLLHGAGYDSVTSTMDSSRVSEFHLVNHYDLILLDLHMPGMDGFQVMENLKEIEKGSYLPVLVVTANPEHKLRALRSGARDFVSKPFDLAEVLLRVHNMLEVRLLHLETRRLYDRVVSERKVSDRLLANVLPQTVVELMKAPPEDTATNAEGLITESYAEVTVLFADVMEFTRFSAGASGQVLAGVLAALATRVEEGGIERKRVVGDAYLAAFGLPDTVADHSIRAAKMALDLTEAMDRFNAHGHCKLKVRIGLDTAEGGAVKTQAAFDL